MKSESKKSKRFLMRSGVAAMICGLMMLLAWSAIFPGVMLESDINLRSRIFIFAMALILDAMFTIEMYKDFTEYKRLSTKRYKYEDHRLKAL